MGKFNASEVEVLEFDFTKFGGGAGEIPEPSTGRVNAFFKLMKAAIKEARGLQATVQSLEEVDEMDEAQVAEQMAKVDEAESGASFIQQRTLEALAELCGADWVGETAETKVLKGGSPSLDQLSTLPYRHLQEFSQWLIKEIQPKKTTPAGKR